MDSERGVIYYDNPEGVSVIISFNENAEIIAVSKYLPNRYQNFLDHIKNIPDFGDGGISDLNMLTGLVKAFMAILDRLSELTDGFDKGRYVVMSMKQDKDSGATFSKN